MRLTFTSPLAFSRVSALRDEPGAGDWTLKVIDRVNPDKNGTLNAWSLVLWGESIDASKTKLYQLPSSQPDTIDDDTEDDETTPPATNSSATVPQVGTATKSFPKPTEHLPDDHASAPGESHLPGLGDPKPPLDTDAASPTPTSGGAADEGVFDGIDTLASGSWIAGAAGFVALAGLAGTGFFFWRRYQARKRAGGGFGGGDDGYGAVPGEEDVAMGLLGGGRSKRSRGAGGGGGTKELYDAFRSDDEEESEGEEEGEERRALGYHE